MILPCAKARGGTSYVRDHLGDLKARRSFCLRFVNAPRHHFWWRLSIFKEGAMGLLHYEDKFPSYSALICKYPDYGISREDYQFLYLYFCTQLSGHDMIIKAYEMSNIIPACMKEQDYIDYMVFEAVLKLLRMRVLIGG
jgi:hypothetical protein